MSIDTEPMSYLNMLLSSLNNPTLGNETPSFFELSLHRSFDASIHSTIKQFIRLLRVPFRSLGPLHLIENEISTFLILLLDSYTMTNYHGTLTESFCGLQRKWLERRSKNDNNETEPLHENEMEMDSMHISQALIITTCIPYLKRYLDNIHELVVGHNSPFGRIEPENFTLDEDLIATLPYHRRLFIKFSKVFKYLLKIIYPYIHVAYEGSFFIFQFLYILGLSKYYSPLLYLLRNTYKRVTPQHLEIFAKKIKDKREVLLRNAFKSNRLVYLFHRLKHFSIDNVKYLLVCIFLLFKGLQWWYSDENEYQRQEETKVIPPPPIPLKPNSQGVSLPLNPNICLLCNNPRSNDAASPSGYLACYPCLYRYISQYNKCPVTHLPCQVESIRRVYAS